MLSPSARAAAIRARWVMLLEPGTATSALIFVAGLNFYHLVMLTEIITEIIS